MKKNTLIKTLACTIIASMAFSFTACGKEGSFTAKKFKSVAMDQLDANEYKLSDFDANKPEEFAGDVVGDIEGGIFATATKDELADFYHELLGDDAGDVFMAMTGLDVKKINSTSFYVREEGIGPKGFDDEYYVLAASLVEYSDKKEAAKDYTRLMENLSRIVSVGNAVCDTDYKVDDLNKQNFKYDGKNKGHLILKVSLDELDLDNVKGMEKTDIEGTLVIGFYIQGKDMLTVVSLSSDSKGSDQTTQFFKSLKMKNPYELESTELLVDFINSILENPDDLAKNLEKMFNSIPMVNMYKDTVIDYVVDNVKTLVKNKLESMDLPIPESMVDGIIDQFLGDN